MSVKHGDMRLNPIFLLYRYGIALIGARLLVREMAQMISPRLLFCLSTSLVALSSPLSAQTSAPAETSAASDDSSQKQGLEIVVTGSRIARRQTEGPAPVTVISGDAIDRSGFRSVFDALTTLTQNTAYVQGEDFGSTFTPAANFVNLRGLGPNHSLVLVNGRRLADYPVAYDG
ncbi:MAG: TonB-dependent receptor plug domain-containing protein, partial [Sphingomonas sp.]|nr:TonB-dependent receptor plug domain-containing protein [Sphingomonas sp.]